MSELIEINNINDIPQDIKGSPIEKLLYYHNLGEPYSGYDKAELLVGMCMDHRKRLRIPEKFAYIIRTGGANMDHMFFYISYAIAVGGVKHFALIGHTDCGMSGVSGKKEAFTDGLSVNGGWNKGAAEELFEAEASENDIGDVISYTKAQAENLREEFPAVIVMPMLYKVEDNRLYLIG